MTNKTIHGLTFGDYRWEVMGEFTRTRLDEEIDMAIELIEEMGTWPWPGSLRGTIEQLVTEAYAFGCEEKT